MNLEGDARPDGSDSPAGEGTIAYQEKTNGTPEQLNGRSGNGVVATGNSQAPTVPPRLPREGARNGTAERKRDVFHELTVGDVRAWLADSGRLHHFEQALTQLSDPVTREQFEAMLRQRLSPAEARSFSSVFAAYFDSPIQLRFNGSSIVPVHVFGAGGEGMVVLGKDMRDVVDMENRTGPVGDVSRHERLKVFKVLHSVNPRSKTGRERVERFQRGTELVEKIKAAHVAAYGDDEAIPPLTMFPEVIDRDFSGDRPWVAYRYQPGYGFDKLVDAYGRKHPWPLRFVCDYAAQAAREIVVRQQLSDPKGDGSVIVHRDLKPANTLVTDQAALQRIDYDLSRRQETEKETHQVTTGQGMFGTPSFMAPEVSRGEQATIAADIFSFGCELYYMLTGKYPFPQAKVGESIAPYACILPGDPPTTLTLPGLEDSRVRGDERLQHFAEILQKDPKARAHVQKVCDFIANEMLHPDPTQRATPMKVAETFFIRSSRGRECSLAEFLQPENFAKTGFILVSNNDQTNGKSAQQSDGELPIPSRFATPKEMLEALLKGSESAEGIEGAYDWLRDVRASDVTKSRPALLKRKTTWAMAGGGIAATTAVSLLWILQGAGNGERPDGNGDPEIKEPPIAVKGDPKIPNDTPRRQEKLIVPAQPRFVAFDEKMGLLFFDEKGEIDRFPFENWYSFSMSKLGNNLGKKPVVYVTWYRAAPFRNLIDRLSPDFHHVIGEKNEGVIYLLRHPEECNFFIDLGIDHGHGAVYVEQGKIPVARYVSKNAMIQDKDIHRILEAYSETGVDDVVDDMMFGKKLDPNIKPETIKGVNSFLRKLRKNVLQSEKVQELRGQRGGSLFGIDRNLDHPRTLSSLLSLNGARYQGVLRSDAVLAVSKDLHWQQRRPGQHRG